jgi:hypothetical protein
MNLAKCFTRAAEKRVECSLVARVADPCVHAHAQRLKLVRRSVKGLLSACADRDIAALRGKGQCRSSADTAARTHDDRPSSLQPQIHAHSSDFLGYRNAAPGNTGRGRFF